MFNGTTLLGQTQTIVNSGNLNYVKAGGSHQIMGAIDIPNTVSDGLYDSTRPYASDSAGNQAFLANNGIIRVTGLRAINI